MEIKHLLHSKINQDQWDNIISNSQNGMIYAYSWFLNCVSPNWEALVSEDFNYIMPLPVKKKYGLKYLVQPELIQQLGIFSNNKIEEQIVCKFIKKIPYLSYDFNLNEQNFSKKTNKLPNYLLELKENYNKLKENFSKNTIRNINKSINNNLEIEWNFSVDNFLKFYFSNPQKYKLPTQKTTITLLKTLSAKNKAKFICIKAENKAIIAVLVLLIEKNRIVYFLPSSNTIGREKLAMYYLIDRVIEKYSSSNYVLDFEGSKIEGVARLYESFGAQKTFYYKTKRFRPKFLIKKT